ncbi:putative virion-associated protein [Vibrio phage 137E35-1]|nr:putative virion-associated protein [Vibrio phage 137E35-1]CAH9015484.1 putative virion-associated protein [Vibrio phage 230E39-1]
MNMPDYYNVFLSQMIESGAGALIIQGYEEVNKKLGVQWEASRILSATNIGDKFYSIMIVGEKPIDLKARTVGATGGGVIARIYDIQPSDFSVSGGGDSWFNLNLAVTDQPLTKLYPESDITFITPVDQIAVAANKKAADVFAVTNDQRQGKGIVIQSFDSGRVLPAGSMVLLELESFDSNQSITARVEMYEGFLDYNI